MASIVISGDTSGSITVSAPAVAGSNTISLPAETGTLAPIVSGTAVTASGTSIDFTSIPSWVKRITVMFSNVSANGSSPYQIQLGTSSGIDATSTYFGTAQNLDATAISNSNNFTTGLRLAGATGSNVVFYGTSTITLLGSNNWTFTSLLGRTDSATQLCSSGGKTLSGTLDRIRITTVGGTDAYDSGTINILYE
jgi:hypothetical protein